MFLMEQEINRASEIFFCLTSHSQLYQCACIFSKKRDSNFKRQCIGRFCDQNSRSLNFAADCVNTQIRSDNIF